MGKTQEENTKTIISNTMTTPKVTVLVAVYNAEKYIRKCLDSLIEQTLTDIQVVCIDDASTDNSLSILNEYAGNRKSWPSSCKKSGIRYG